MTNEFSVPESTDRMKSGPGLSCSPGRPMYAIQRLPNTCGMNHTNPMMRSATFPTITPTQLTAKLSAIPHSLHHA